jgi:putative spermidine/putrescine transport system permease protein
MTEGSAAATTVPTRAPTTAETVAARRRLKARLGRVERRHALRAMVLVVPMLAFLLLTFLAPIGRMLYRAIEDPEMVSVLPRTAAALRAWDGAGLPPDNVFGALVGEMPAAMKAHTLASVAQRLNHDVSGFRSLVLHTARKLPKAAPAGARETLIALDPRWGEPATWAAMRRAARPWTDFYLLTAVDLHHDAAGDIVRVPPDVAVFVDVLARTLWISLMVTAICVALGFPVAYLLATLPAKSSNLLMILVLLPFWTSLLVRTSAWVVILQNEGILNGLMLHLGLIDAPVQMIFNRFGVYVAMTHVLLPFMVLPLYSVMKGISPAYMRAAASLGAPPWTAFLRVYLPQTLPGITAGCLLVFILALGYYITPALVGGADDQMVSYFIAFYTNRTVNWGLAAALATLLLAATVVLFGVYSRVAGTTGVRLG